MWVGLVGVRVYVGGWVVLWGRAVSVGEYICVDIGE